jgi:NADH:ubiquinone oxidoreductase subunit 2 (subunit N)
VTLLLLASVALGAGLGVVFVAEARPAIAVLLGLAASLVVLGIALAMPPEESVAIGGVSLVGTALVRAMVVAWAASLAVLTLLEALVGRRPTVVGPSLIGLAVAAVALASVDPAMAVAALAAGGAAGVLVPGLEGWLDGASAASRLPTTARGTFAILGSGLLAIGVIAWAASAAGPLGSAGIIGKDTTQRLALGLALLAMVAAVALRTGLIPFHVWVARFMEGVSPLAIPATLTWGSAAFVLVAVEWSQVALQPIAAGDIERLLIIGLGLISVVLGGLAAMFHDDIEHVLGYSILADAGVGILAFASLEPEAAAAARNWLVASASVKTALAAWAAIVRATYGGHRLAELAGWARRSPALGLAFLIILVAAIGLPGMALFEARSTLVNGAVGSLGGVLTLAVAAMPAVYLGRIAAAGIAPISAAVSTAPSGRPRWSGARAAGWSGGTVAQTLRALPVEVRENRAPLMALGVLLLAVMSMATAMGGAGG